MAAEPASSPLRGPGLLARALPFAVVAVMAEASLALPPGARSRPAVIVSLVLLLAVAAAFLLPWARLPAWSSVIVPLAYTGSVLALILAAGTTSGVGIVILIPLIWTALFHRWWESGCIVAAIVAVEVVISLTPQPVPDSVIVRRVLLWATLGVLVSIATHGLRERIRRAQEASDRLETRVRELMVLEDRDRIARQLQDLVIKRLFAAGLSLQAAASMTASKAVASRVESAIGDLDMATRLIRQSIFGMTERLHADGLRQGILDLCGELVPPGGAAPEVTFSGQIDSAFSAGSREQLLEVLREALVVIGKCAWPTHVGLAADDGVRLTVVGAAPEPEAARSDKHGLDDHGQDAGADRHGDGGEDGDGGGNADGDGDGDGDGQYYARLRASARRMGARIDIDPAPSGGTRFSWHFPMGLPSRG